MTGRTLRRGFVATVLLALAGGIVFFGLAYPALFPLPLEEPAVESDPLEQRTALDSPLTLELRGSYSEEEVREGLEISPPLDPGDVTIDVERMAPLPWHTGMPWAKTRVLINHDAGRLWQPETSYEISILDEEFAFETIVLPRVVSVLADEDGVPFDNLPTNRGLIIRFNEEVDWDDRYLSVVPPTEVEVMPGHGGEDNSVLVRPAERWENFERYTVKVLEGLPDVHGHLLEEEYDFGFTTWPPPRITRVVPEGSGLGPDAVIEVDFERAADRASVESGFTIDPPLDGSFEWLSDTEMVWRPDSLPYSQTFEVAVGGLAEGGDLFESRTFSFATHDPPVFVEIRGSGDSPSIIEAVPSGGLGSYTLQWNTGETASRILASAPYGESKRYEITVISGDQAAVAAIDLDGHPWPHFTPQPCTAGWHMTDISVCTRSEELPGPVRAQIARIDPRDPSLVLGQLPTSDTVGGTATVSSRAVSAGSIVAVNGDLFRAVDGGMYTVGPLISSGGYAYSSHYEGAYFALDGAGNASVGIGPDLRLSVWGQASGHGISAVNAAPADGQIAVFNGYRTASVPAFEGCYVTLAAYGGDMVDEASDIRCGDIGQVPVIEGGFTLVGRGTGADWLRANVPGVLTLAAPGHSLVVGGSHVLQPYIAEGNGYSVGGRHPRTAIGTDAAGFLYLVVVDGRSWNSIGMTIPELSSYLGSLGITQAINLDGGGSSTFVVHGQVWNSPSDGQERKVASVISVGRAGHRGCSHSLVRC